MISASTSSEVTSSLESSLDSSAAKAVGIRATFLSAPLMIASALAIVAFCSATNASNLAVFNLAVFGANCFNKSTAFNVSLALSIDFWSLANCSAEISFLSSFLTTTIPLSVAWIVTLYPSAAAFTSASEFSQMYFPLAAFCSANLASALSKFVCATSLDPSAAFTFCNWSAALASLPLISSKSFLAFSSLLLAASNSA